MKKKTSTVVILALAFALLAGVAVYAATSYGSKDDPLVAKSYLTGVAEPEIQAQVSAAADAAADEAEAAFSAELSAAAGAYQSVTLSDGQTLALSAGGEALLRAGTATAAGTLTDSTAGADVAFGEALAANHLYIAPADGAALCASGAVTLMVRGGYSVR